MKPRKLTRVITNVLAVTAVTAVALSAWWYLDAAHYQRQVISLTDAALPGVVPELQGDAMQKMPSQQVASARTRPMDPDDLADSSVWASRVDALWKAADSGDPAASIQLFEESNQCRRYHAAIEGAKARLNDDRLLEAAWPTAADFDRAEAELREMQQVIETASPLCAGSDPDQVETGFQDFLLRAAKLGHVPAQSCYLRGPHLAFQPDPDHELELIDQYLGNAPAFSDNALVHADWSAVRLLAYRLIAAPLVPTTRLDHMPMPDPYLTWRAVRLNYYRAHPGQQPYITDLLDRIADRYDLSEFDRQVADQWAQGRFDQFYANLPLLEDMENTPSCPQFGEPLGE